MNWIKKEEFEPEKFTQYLAVINCRDGAKSLLAERELSELESNFMKAILDSDREYYAPFIVYWENGRYMTLDYITGSRDKQQEEEMIWTDENISYICEIEYPK